MAKSKAAKKVLDSYVIKGTHKVVKAGDCVLLRASDPGNPPYVARLEKIEADSRNNVKVYVRWYYRPEESMGGRRQFHGAKELFLSDHYDIQSGDTIEGKCTVHTFKSYTKLESVSAEDYFCRFEYKASTGGFIPDRVAVYCKCEMPYNPDDLMVQCEACKDCRSDLLGCVESRWTFMSRPIHAMAAMLHPLYRSPELWSDTFLNTKQSEYVGLMFTEDDQLEIDKEFTNYMNGIDASFTRAVSLRKEVTKTPLTWWHSYGRVGLPNLSRIALRILSQDCSAGACERNWSAYSLIHTKIRNRLSTTQLEKLVYCRANMRLVRSYHSLGQPKRFHPSCMNLSQEQVKKMDHYVCPDCDASGQPEGENKQGSGEGGSQLEDSKTWPTDSGSQDGEKKSRNSHRVFPRSEQKSQRSEKDKA
ncbi:hypothetical protein L7F22_017145 [Adiantum nelumboides]|nr:hypothetical protein [Adiantum nelumboides]